jgi:predicted DNA-binding transcriptional regulator AlpA
MPRKKQLISAAPVAPAPDELVGDPKMWRELGIERSTAYRWERDEDMAPHFPTRVHVRGRNYRVRSEVEKFKQWLLRRAIEARRVA